MAMEKDIHLARMIKNEWPGIVVFVMDALNYSWEKLGRAGVRKVIGNLPYNVASPIIWEFVSRAPMKTSAVFMVQKEVAQRIAASPGGKTFGALSVWSQAFADVQLLFTVGPNVFRPRPRVDSAVIKLEPRAVQIPHELHMHLGRTIKKLFSQRRKQLGTILKSMQVDDWHNMLETLEIDHRLRPEQLTVDAFCRIAALTRSRFSP